MNPLVIEVLGALFRWAATAALAWMLSRGVIDAELAGRAKDYVGSPAVVLGVVGLLTTAALAVWTRVQSRHKFLTAMAMPAESTENDVNAVIADPKIETPPLSKPADKPSYLKVKE